MARPDDTIVATAATFFVLGYAGAASMSVWAFEHDGWYGSTREPDATCFDVAGALALVPVFGGIAAGVALSQCTVPGYANYGPGLAYRTRSGLAYDEASGVIGLTLSGVAQLVSFTTLVIALAAPGTGLVWASEHAAVSMEVQPVAQGAVLSLRATTP